MALALQGKREEAFFRERGQPGQEAWGSSAKLQKVEVSPVLESQILPIPTGAYAGRLRLFVREWRDLVPGRQVMESVTGYKIPFLSTLEQAASPPNGGCAVFDAEFISSEVQSARDRGGPALCPLCGSVFIASFYSSKARWLETHDTKPKGTKQICYFGPFQVNHN